MNNKYILSTLCIAILSLAPACGKKKCRTKQDIIKTAIDLDSNVSETKNNKETEQSVAKF